MKPSYVSLDLVCYSSGDTGDFRCLHGNLGRWLLGSSLNGGNEDQGLCSQPWRSWEEGEIREVLFNWYRISAWYNENVLEIDSSHGHKSLWMHIYPLQKSSRLIMIKYKKSPVLEKYQKQEFSLAWMARRNKGTWVKLKKKN